MKITKHRGVSGALVAIVIIVIVAAGGAASYVYFTSNQSKNTQSTSFSLPPSPSSSTNSSSASSTTSQITSSYSSSTSTITITSSSSSKTSSTSSSVSTTSSTSESTSAISTTVSSNCVNLSLRSADPVPSFMTLLSHFSAIGVNETSKSVNSSASVFFGYNTIYHTSTYKLLVNGKEVDKTTGGTNEFNTTLWIKNNGTVSAAMFEGQNLTGQYANKYGAVLMDVFVTVFTGYNVTRSLQNYIHMSSTQDITITGTTLHAITYSANELPFTVTTCSNGTNQRETVTGFSVQVAQVPNSSLQLVSNLSISGYPDSNTTALETFSMQLVILKS
jgi:flagellar basal body-associated protein FliL